MVCAETYDLSKEDIVKLTKAANRYSFASEKEKEIVAAKIQKFCDLHNVSTDDWRFEGGNKTDCRWIESEIIFCEMSAKLEINIKTLLVHCEELVKDDSQRWRLSRYIKSLDSMLKELED